MQITFYGAIREVTGSMHLISTPTDNILLDCGMFQGRRKETAAKNCILPFDPEILSSIVLSHAHIDHSGRLPLLTKNGFSGRIVCTRPTAAACEYLLTDSASIQESDANYLKYKLVRRTLSEVKKSRRARAISKAKLNEIKALLKKGRHELKLDTINALIDKYQLESVEPLYTVADAKQALSYFDGYPYRQLITIGKRAACTLYDAGHILGSAISIITLTDNAHTYRICYTGDIGRFDKPIVNDPTINFSEEDRNIDLLIMESTYGDRVHGPIVDLKPKLRKVLMEAYQRGGSVLIPAFAFGRTQTLLYLLHELYNENSVPHMPIFVDSPLAANITRVFGEHPEVYDEESHRTFLTRGENPFYFDKIQFVQSVEESMALNRDQSPHIVLAASGMCEAGRILHHLRHKIHNSKNTILIVGFMAQNTLGRRIEENGRAYQNRGRHGDPPLVKILNKLYPLKAEVVKIGGFSAHADKEEMKYFLNHSNLKIKRIALVHGEEEPCLTFADELRSEGYELTVPRKGETIHLG